MRTRLNLIHTLRGVAALLIVLHHITLAVLNNFEVSWLGNWFLNGWCGVDFFFVLSGFIITYTCLKQIEQKTGVREFLLKRVVRIYPIYWIVLFLTLPRVFVGSNDGITLSLQYFVNNLLLVPQTQVDILDVAWSLKMEIIFYAAFGICIIGGDKVAKSIFYVWPLALLIINPFLAEVDSPFLSYLFSYYVIEFLMGCWVALILRKFNLSYKAYSLSGIVGMVTFIVSWYLAGTGLFERGDLLSRVLFGISSSMMIFGAAGIDSVKRQSFHKSLVLLGDASYVLYLIHPIVIIVVFKSASILVDANFLNLSELTVNLIASVATLCSVVAGILLHNVIERRLLEFFSKAIKKKQAQRVAF